MHIPVLLQEVIGVLNPKPGEFFIDGTLGAGGHASALLRRLEPGGTFLGLDWDSSAVEKLRADLQRRFPKMQKVTLASGNYAEMKSRLSEQSLPRANGLLLDLGFSSTQLGDGRPRLPNGQAGLPAGRQGFSFAVDEPLAMTYSADAVPVFQILQTISEKDLRTLIFEFGEERHAAAIASAIINARSSSPIATSGQLARLIETVVPRRGRLHPATKTFMALRIFANQELENLSRLLKDLPEIMAPEGKVGIISFHSLEDRMVKRAFRELEKAGSATLINKKPITATEEELFQNPRARSAKLRAIVFH